MENSTTNTETSISSSATYQCVVCQTTYISLSELHRHQSYRHTPEELSLSTIGLHCSAIKMFETQNGIVYDNSWLHDPSRHAEFYAYSSNMLCDNNNNSCIMDCTKKNQAMVGESSIVTDLANENTKKNKEMFVNEKFVTTINEPLVSIENFTEQESCVWEPTILDLTLKVSSESMENETVMQGDEAQHLFGPPIEKLCDDFKKMTRVAAKRGSSSRKCPTPRKVRRVTSKKKLCIPKNKANTQVVEDTSQDTAELEKQNDNKADCIEQKVIFGSQDSMSHFAEKNVLPVARNRKFGQQKPLNLTKVVKKTCRQRNTTIVKKSENQTNGKTVPVSHVSNFNLDHYLTYLKDQKKQTDDKPEENSIKEDANKKNENVEEISAVDLTKEKTSCDAVIVSNQDYENKNSPKNRSIFDSETPASSVECKEVKIETESGVTTGKSIDTEKKTEQLKIVADNSVNDQPPTEIQKCSNQDGENEDSLGCCSISDPQVSPSSLRVKEDKIDIVEPPTKPAVKADKSISMTEAKILDTVSDNPDEEETAFRNQKYSDRCYKNRKPKFRAIIDTDESSTDCYTLPAINATKSISSKKQTKKSKTQANKSGKSQVLQKSFANENSEIKAEFNHNMIFNSINFSSAFEEEEMKFRDKSTVKDKKRVSPRKRVKNPKTMADKLPQREKFREINDPGNQDYENDNFAEEKSNQILDVYSYTDNDNEDAAIATLSEFRARTSASVEKKWSADNVANIKCSHDNSSFTPVAGAPIGCSSNEEPMDAQPLKETKKRTSSRKKAANSKLASATSVVEEAGQKIVKCYFQDGAGGNSVDQNSIAIPEANFHVDNVGEEATIETQQGGILEKTDTFEMQTEYVEIDPNDPITRTPQEIEAVFYRVYGDEDFGANNSDLEIEEYFFIQNENEEATIDIPCIQNVQAVNDIAMDSAETIDNTETEQCGNGFSIEYCPKYSENQPSSRTSGVSFVAYPPGIDEYSALIFDPEIGHLVWRSIELDDPEAYELQFDEMQSSGEINNDNNSDVLNNENMSTPSNVDSETSNTSWIPDEINILASDGDSSSQNNNPTRRSTRTKRAVNRYVP